MLFKKRSPTSILCRNDRVLQTRAFARWTIKTVKIRSSGKTDIRFSVQKMKKTAKAALCECISANVHFQEVGEYFRMPVLHSASATTLWLHRHKMRLSTSQMIKKSNKPLSPFFFFQCVAFINLH